MQNSNPSTLVEVTSKPWWESKTMRFNALVGTLSLLGALAMFLLDSQRAGLLPFEIDVRWLLLAVGLINVINIWLRAQTNQPITRNKAE